MEPNELRRALIAASDRWRQLDTARSKAKDAVMQAAADYLLGSDVQAEEVANLTPFSDATVRAATRKLGVPARRRGPQRKPESKPESKIVTAAVTPPVASATQPPFTSSSMPVNSRVAEMLDFAASLTPAEQVQAAERIRSQYATWLHGLRLKPATDAELIEAACRANVPNYSDLRP